MEFGPGVVRTVSQGACRADADEAAKEAERQSWMRDAARVSLPLVIIRMVSFPTAEVSYGSVPISYKVNPTLEPKPYLARICA